MQNKTNCYERKGLRKQPLFVFRTLGEKKEISVGLKNYFDPSMNLFRKLFNINTVILAFAIFLMVIGIVFFIQSFDGFDKLTRHNGVVESKYLSYNYSTRHNFYVDRDEPDSDAVFNFKVVDNAQWYTTSKLPTGVDNLIEIGDSIDFYTKKVTSSFGNMVSNGSGKAWNTTSPNEVFHLVSNKYPDPVVDFYEYRSDVRSLRWIAPFASLIMFGWYLYRRSGRKSALVSEYSHFS